MIKFNCVHCGHETKVPDDAAGKFGKCKKCGERIQVPATSQPESSQEENPFAMLDEVPEEDEFGFPDSQEIEERPLPVSNQQKKNMREGVRQTDQNSDHLQTSAQKYRTLMIYLSVVRITTIVLFVIALIVIGIIAATGIGQYASHGNVDLLISAGISLVGAALYVVTIMASLSFIQVIIDIEYNTRKIAAKL